MGVYVTSLGEPTVDEIDPGWRLRDWADSRQAAFGESLPHSPAD